MGGTAAACLARGLDAVFFNGTEKGVFLLPAEVVVKARLLALAPVFVQQIVQVLAHGGELLVLVWGGLCVAAQEGDGQRFGVGHFFGAEHAVGHATLAEQRVFEAH